MEFVIFPMLALIIGVVLDGTNERIRFLHIPNTILIFSYSFFVSAVLHTFLPNTLINAIDEKYTWRKMEAEHIVMILLPPMIFESAFKINSHLFFRKLKLLTALTAVVYLTTLAIQTALMFPILRITDNWSIFTVTMLASILSATDPVAVVAILEEIGAPQRLRILIEGESLLNDGLSIFAYNIFSIFVKAESQEIEVSERWYHFAIMGAKCVILSPIVGIVCSRFVVRAIRLGIKDNKKIQMFLLITVYVLWGFGEHFQASPAVIIVFYGVGLNYVREQLEPSTVEMALQMWASFGYWANCCIFCYGGYCIGMLLFASDFEREAVYLFLSGCLMYPFGVLSRMLALFVFKYIWESFGGKKLQRSDYVLLGYGGLKGALSLLLAHDFTHSVHETDPACEKIGHKVVLYCSASVGLCLIIQGMTFSLMTEREGTNHRSRFIKDSEKNLESHLNHELRVEMEKMKRQSELYLTEANWKVVYQRIEANVFKGFSAGLGSQSRVQSSEECSAAATTETCDENVKSEHRIVCAGYYSILLARVNDMWARGALSGSAAHIIVELLEHGIDEEQLDLEDFKEHLKTTEMWFFERISFSILKCLMRWIDKDTWLNRFCQISEQVLKHPLPQEATVIVHEREKEGWTIFSSLTCTVFSVLLAFAIYHPMDASLSYYIIVCTFLICMILFIEELYYFHRYRKPIHKLELNRHGMECTWLISRFATEMCFCVTLVLLIIGTVACASILLISISDRSCLQMTGVWRQTKKCYVARLLTLVFFTLVCVLKLLRIIPLLIFTSYEAIFVRKLIKVRVELSALYLLQYILSQPPVTFHLFPDNAFKVALVEQKYLNKITDALIRKTMKQNEEILDVVPVIKTRQAIRMASHALHTTIKTLNSQGLIHEESFEMWNHSLERLRNDGDRLISTPETEVRDVLGCVHWIEALESRKRQILIDKLVDYFDTARKVIIEYNQPIPTHEAIMFFLKRGITRVTETSWSKDGSVHRHDYYVHQGKFIGERNLLYSQETTVDSIKKPKVVYQTTTDCHLIEVNLEMMKFIRTYDLEITSMISKKEQRRRIVYELKEHNQMFSLMTLEDFDKLFKLCSQMIPRMTKFQVDAGKKLIIGWRTLVCDVDPISAIDDHYHIIGPAAADLRPVEEDDGMVLLIDNIRQSDQATSDEPESNLSLSIDTSSTKKNKKKGEGGLKAAIKNMGGKGSHVKRTSAVSLLRCVRSSEMISEATQEDSTSQQYSRRSNRGLKTAKTQSEAATETEGGVVNPAHRRPLVIPKIVIETVGAEKSGDQTGSPGRAALKMRERRMGPRRMVAPIGPLRMRRPRGMAPRGSTVPNSGMMSLREEPTQGVSDSPPRVRKQLSRSSLSSKFDNMSQRELAKWRDYATAKLKEVEKQRSSEAKISFSSSKKTPPSKSKTKSNSTKSKTKSQSPGPSNR